MSRLIRALCAASAAVAAHPEFVFAQTAELPQIVVRGAPSELSAPAASLTVPDTERARTEIDRTPGAVAIVPDTAFKNTPAATIKDIVD